MPTPTPTPRRAVLAAAMALALAAISAAALLVRASRSGPITISFYRLLYATALLLPAGLLRPRVRRELAALGGRELATLAGIGAVLALHFATWIASLAPSSPFATSVAASSALVVTHPVLVALATPWVLRERLPPRALWGMALALAGAVWIAVADARTGERHRVVGDLLAFAGAGCGAAYLLAGRRLRARLGLLSYVLPVYASAALVLALLAHASGESLAVVSVREHLLFLALALGPMVLGHTVFNWALAHLPAWVVSTTILAEPLGAVALVFLVLGERPPARALAGGVVILGGVLLASLASERAADRAPD